MDCHEIKKLIPLYLDHELGEVDQQQVDAHVQNCPDCQREAREIEKSWELLGEIKAVEPDPNYLARFWQSVDAQMPWYAGIYQDVLAVFQQRRWAPALAGAVIVALISTIATVQFLQKPNDLAVLAELDETELEMVANIDLAEHFEIIHELDFFTDFDIIEKLNGLGAS
ncbi:MAG: zf-HC2 domain-containing protein [Desulfobacterales bacterium]|jgi:anti-sigma factor RsiW